jgi:hypothetical protein
MRHDFESLTLGVGLERRPDYAARRLRGPASQPLRKGLPSGQYSSTYGSSPNEPRTNSLGTWYGPWQNITIMDTARKLTEAEIVEVFRLAGLESEEKRAQFNVWRREDKDTQHITTILMSDTTMPIKPERNA